jgi:ABC-2 type transport system permease protein
VNAVLASEVLEQLRAIVREPAALLFSIVLPVGMFVLFVNMWGDQGGAAGLPVGTTMLATFGTFGVLSVCLFNPGLSVADDRERGWLRAKRVSPTPLPVTLAAKVIGALPYAVGALVAMCVAAAATGTLDASGVALVRLVGALVLGSLPFALFSLALGFRATTNTAVAVLQAVLFPMVIASGLWFPLEALPDAVSSIAPFLPTYHLAEFGMAQLTGGVGLDHAAVLLATGAVGAVLATVSYRSARP